MQKLIAILFFALCIQCTQKSFVTIDSFSINSKVIDDDFLIQIKKPADYNSKKNYTIIYVADGTIGLGQYVLGTDSNWRAVMPQDCIVVTIGHTGNWHQKRPRDFIPSDISNNKEKEFGNADQFYDFLKSEIIPFVNKQLPHQKRKVFIGHSFSGLFCLYAALKNEKLFDEYFAISPSVWANDNELLKIEEGFAQSNKDLNATIHIYAGSLEVFNKVLFSSRKFYKNLQSRYYKNILLSFEEISTANHFSIRKPAIDKILKSLAK